MSENKPQAGAPVSQDDEAIAEAAARLSAKWALAAKTPTNDDGKQGENQQGADKPFGNAVSGPIVQTLEKGRTHMVTVEVKRRRGRGVNSANESNGKGK